MKPGLYIDLFSFCSVQLHNIQVNYYYVNTIDVV